MPNPYTLVFGQPPVEIIERSPQAERIISEFCSPAPLNYLNLITGIRGSGKTVFVTEIANRLSGKRDWIVINLNPQRDLLTSLAARLNSIRGLNKVFRDAKINLEFLGIGVGIETAPPIMDIEEALLSMMRSIKKQGKKVLITVDEVTNSQNMRIFASSYQIMLREKLPVFLLMTGLYKNMDSLRNAEGMTFLERAPRTMLKALDSELMAENYRITLKASRDRAARLAALTKGYSFAFQTIGYFSWENRENEQEALNRARDYLYEFAYDKIWSELSRNDRKIAAAIAEAKTDTVAVYDIREKLNYSSNQFNPYRDRLLKAGIIHSPENGQIEFSLPFFGEYALRKNHYTE